MLDIRYLMLDARCSMLDAGCVSGGGRRDENIEYRTRNLECRRWGFFILTGIAVLFRMSYCVYRMSSAEACGAVFDLMD